MAAITPDASGHDKLGPLASRYVDVAELPWQATKYSGIEMKVLMKDEDAGLTTALFGREAGARLPLHEHTGIEQTYVLEGSLADNEGEVTAGNYVWRPAGSRHSAHSPNGVLANSFFLSPNRFLEEELAEPEQGR